MKKFIVLLIIGSLTSCSAIKGSASKGKDAFIDCAKKDVADKAIDLVSTVIGAAASGSLIQVLEALALKFGEDVAACAAQGAEQALMAQVPAGGPKPDDPTVIKLNKVKMAISEKKWTYAEGSK